MSEEQEKIVDLVKTLVSSLVDDQDAIGIESVEEAGALVVNITVSEDETGKVIGRQGRVIKALRTLARAAGSQNGISVEVEVLG